MSEFNPQGKISYNTIYGNIYRSTEEGYVKPSGGIPKSDLSASVQSSLDKADGALQTAQGTEYSGYYMVVNSDGDIVPQSVSASGTTVTVGGVAQSTVAFTSDPQTQISAKYSKPTDGIPKTDLASDVQTSLEKADSAYQKPSSGIPKSDLIAGVKTSLNKADSAYQLPSDGIPASDMSSAVQTSLGLADSALQSVPNTYRTSAAQDTIDEGKVDKVTGKGLSTNDYTDTDQANITANTTARHTHSNKALLDTYTQTESDLADAVSKKHTHDNKSVLDGITSALVTAWNSAVTWITTNGANVLSHIASTGNPHSVTKAQLGLGNVNNTSDADKPISTATQTALDAKGTYSKPSGGIPESDLASDVQTSLGLADSALQSVPNTYRTSAAQDVIDSGKENAGKITIGGVEKTASSHTITIVTNGTTTTLTIVGVT